MKTEELVAMLARQAGPAPQRFVAGRVAMAGAVGLLLSAGAALSTLGLNPGLTGMGGALLVKLAYVVGVTASASWLFERLARPGTSVRSAILFSALVLLAMSLVAAASVAGTDSGARLDLLLGRSWRSCPWRVAALSLVPLVAALWTMRGLAPTRPRAAGFVAGLLAGGLGALGYALYCPERSALFVLVWYTAGMLIPAVAGALLGPRLLRW